MTLAEHLEFEEILEPLKDPAYVAKVRIIDEGVTIGWPRHARDWCVAPRLLMNVGRSRQHG